MKGSSLGRRRSETVPSSGCGQVTRPGGLCALVVSEVAVGEALVGVIGVVGEAVVVAAEQDRVGQVGGAAVGPGVEVVGFGPGWWPVAAFGAAALVAQGQRNTLGFAE